MATLTAENVLQMINQMPPAEQAKLKRLLEQHESTPSHQVGLLPIPDSKREMRWLAEHQREYAGQWVALDGDRLIAASASHEEVAAAAEADGAYLPMFAFVDDPEKTYAGF